MNRLALSTAFLLSLFIIVASFLFASSNKGLSNTDPTSANGVMIVGLIAFCVMAVAGWNMIKGATRKAR